MKNNRLIAYHTGRDYIISIKCSTLNDINYWSIEIDSEKDIALPKNVLKDVFCKRDGRVFIFLYADETLARISPKNMMATGLPFKDAERLGKEIDPVFKPDWCGV